MKRPVLWKRRPDREDGIWYYRLATEATFHSTGTPVRSEAETRVLNDPGLRIRTPRASGRTVSDFCRDFFVWGRCSWLARQKAKGRGCGYQVAKDRRAHLMKWILPAFGNRALKSLTKSELETWLVGLPLANQTKNHIITTIRIVLHEAEDSGIITASPRLEPMGRDYRPRDAFTVSELGQLFPSGTAALTAIWGRYQHAVMYLLMASTGLRAGEVRALQWRQVLWHARDLLVDRAIKANEEVGPTKTGETRVVPLPRRAFLDLSRWRGLSIWRKPEDLVFPGADRGIPVGKYSMSDRVARAIERINEAAEKAGLPAAVDIAGRNLVAHSFRHSYNTILRGLDGDLRRALTGHKTEAMTSRYDHPQLADRIAAAEPARAAIEKLLG